MMGPAPFPAALAKLKEPPPTGSWRVEAITKDGKRWVNGVRLETKEEVRAYVVHHVPYDLEEAGYVTGTPGPQAVLARPRSPGKGPNACGGFSEAPGGLAVRAREEIERSWPASSHDT
jgi:hypothetical protein